MRIVRQLGHGLHDTYAALTPLTADPPVHAPLAGVSLEVTVDAPLAKGSLQSRGGFLFTHRGYSGPTVLDVSHLAVRSARDAARRQPVLGAVDGDGRARRGRRCCWRPGRAPSDRSCGASCRSAWRTRCWTSAGWTRSARGRSCGATSGRGWWRRWPAIRLPWTGDEGYKKAEVTGGGVPLGEVDPRTGESRVVPGLFLCGEILDCFGPIGGYNFFWAWATGRAAGLGAAASVNG